MVCLLVSYTDYVIGATVICEKLHSHAMLPFPYIRVKLSKMLFAYGQCYIHELIHE
jgi:hypothetical protein